MTFHEYKERLTEAFREASERAARLEDVGGSGVEIENQLATADAYSNALSWAELVDEIDNLKLDQRLMHGGQ